MAKGLRMASPKSIPLPSPIHYELLMQLLERQTLPDLDPQSPQRQQFQELVATLRKALVLQEKLQVELERAGHSIEHRWSLNPKPATGN